MVFSGYELNQLYFITWERVSCVCFQEKYGGRGKSCSVFTPIGKCAPKLGHDMWTVGQRAFGDVKKHQRHSSNETVRGVSYVG